MFTRWLVKGAVLAAFVSLSGCAFRSDVYQARPANSSVTSNSSMASSGGQLKFLTVWSSSDCGNGKPADGKCTNELQVPLWCVPHNSKFNTKDSDFEKNVCAYNIVLEDYKASPPSEPKKSLIEYFSHCTADDITCRQMRNSLYAFLLKTARGNCLSYISQVFTTKETTDGAVMFTKDMLAGGTVTAAAKGSPPVAGGLGLISLLTNSYDKVSTSIFEGATARVLAEAVDQAQQNYVHSLSSASGNFISDKCSPSSIKNGSTYGDCDVFQTLDFMNELSSKCSLKGALAILEDGVKNSNINETAKHAENAANEAKANAVAALNTVNSVSALPGQVQEAGNAAAKAMKVAEDTKTSSAQDIAALKQTISDLQESVQQLQRNAKPADAALVSTPVVAPATAPADKSKTPVPQSDAQPAAIK